MNSQDAYAAAGVDTVAADRAVELMKNAVRATHGPTVVPQYASFAGEVVDASVLKEMRRPLLVSSTDGVGTKVAIAQALGVHNTIGQDLVAMVVDDLAPVGARPLSFTDYIACGKVVPERIAQIVQGIAAACAQVECPLVGGETAEHPGLLDPDEYDVAGAATGVVDAPFRLDAARVAAGDTIVALAASGLHSNGFSLVRKIVADARWTWQTPVADLSRPASGPFAGATPPTMGEVCLEPTRLYAKVCAEITSAGQAVADAHTPDSSGGEGAVSFAPSAVKAWAHVTGGGLAANLARVVPAGYTAEVYRDRWEVPALYRLLANLAHCRVADFEDTLNLGIGMVGIVQPSFVPRLVSIAQTYDIAAWELGQVCAKAAPLESLQLPPGAVGRSVSGTKGVHGGSVTWYGEYLLP